MGNSILKLFSSPCFWGGLLGWCVAQTIKMLIDLIRTRKIDFSYYISTGGMPSAHSALVSGLATAVGLTEGFGSSSFAIALAFASITMFDAAGVRNAAGQQAKILNQIVEELFAGGQFNFPKLKELLGHTQFEVFAGMATGIVVALLVVHFFPHTAASI